jgi:hypothetical protein
MKDEPSFPRTQMAALERPHGGGSLPPQGCSWRDDEGRSALLTCDIDDESGTHYGGPVWHVPVRRLSRAHAVALIAGVGEGVVFEESGLDPDILHLRMRMTAEEIRQLGVRES